MASTTTRLRGLKQRLKNVSDKLDYKDSIDENEHDEEYEILLLAEEKLWFHIGLIESYLHEDE